MQPVEGLLSVDHSIIVTGIDHKIAVDSGKANASLSVSPSVTGIFSGFMSQWQIQLASGRSVPCHKL